jgi:anaerobic magnesium-protoporphyrin IX monomethyl ester cyclase
MVRRESLAAPADLSIGLVTLNARYVHLALSLRCLRNAARAAGFAGTWIAEYTIQTPLWKVAAELLARRPAVLGFSVYIWNRRETLELVERLKKADPALRIVLGGPEVSFEPPPPAASPAWPLSPYVDAVIAGEGERKWVECLELLAAGRAPDDATRRRWAAYGSDLPALDALPYTEEDLAPEAGLAERLVYLETSRGCPFTCSFCLSALDETVRFYPDDAVRAHIERLVAAGARRIKFLDRTFNLRKPRVRALFRWLMGLEGRDGQGLEFHFEVVGDLLDAELLALLAEAPPGRFQFEIGVQSASAETQARVARRQHQPRLFEAVRRLLADGRVHLHLDLIWGLPGESLADIRASFEQVIALHPHELQLGFLKFLPGAPIRALIGPEGYVFQDGPPYEVIAHRRLPAADVLALKRFADAFERVYNRARFRFTLRRLMEARGAWAVFEALAEHFAARGLLVPALGLEALAEELRDCARDWIPAAELEDRLKLDYFYHHRARRVPAFLNGREAAETPAVRARRKAQPDAAVAAFQHAIALHDGQAELAPSPAPVWYAFAYPQRAAGYFFQPTLERIAG